MRDLPKPGVSVTDCDTGNRSACEARIGTSSRYRYGRAHRDDTSAMTADGQPDRDRLVMEHSYLVTNEMARYRAWRLDRADLHQSGLLGSAAPSRYAGPWTSMVTSRRWPPTSPPPRAPPWPGCRASGPPRWYYATGSTAGRNARSARSAAGSECPDIPHVPSWNRPRQSCAYSWSEYPSAILGGDRTYVLISSGVQPGLTLRAGRKA